MTITPRKNETDAVVAVLESDEYEDPTAMAKQIVKTLAAELAKRDAFGVAVGLKSDDLRLAHGPYWTAAQAKKVVKEAQDKGLEAYAAPLLAPDRAVATDEEVARATRCAGCNHPHELHGVSLTTHTGRPKPMASLGCAVYHRQTKEKCPCPGFKA